MSHKNLTVLETESADILNQHIKMVESIHPNINECSLSIKNKGPHFVAKIRGRFKKELISGEASDRAPMKAYIKAHQNFYGDIKRIRVREEIEDVMSDFSMAL